MTTGTSDSAPEASDAPATIGELAQSMRPGEVRRVLGYRVTMVGWFPLADGERRR